MLLESFEIIISAIVAPLLIYIFGIFMHELGHLAGCLLVGWKPLVFSLSTGGPTGKRKITVFRVGDFSAEVGVPFSGYVQAVPRTRKWFRLKFLVFVAMAPLVNIALAIWVFTVGNFDSNARAHPWDVGNFFCFFFIYQVLIAVGTLYPRQTNTGGTDGLKMWRILRMKKETMDQTYRSLRWQFAKQLAMQGRTAGLEYVVKTMMPESATTFEVRHITASTLMVYGKNDECEPLLHKLLTEAKPGEQHSKILDELACIPIYRGKLEMLDEALGYIDEAIAEAPERMTLKATKAALLVEKGAYDEAGLIFEKVLEKEEKGRDFAISKCYLALSSHRRGNNADARKFFSEAEKAFPNYPLLPRVKKEIVATSA